jgi:hypothetical protein
VRTCVLVATGTLQALRREAGPRLAGGST